jgi:hypothetical protein
MSTGKEIQTSDFRFIRRDPQPIELPLENNGGTVLISMEIYSFYLNWVRDRNLFQSNLLIVSHAFENENVFLKMHAGLY